MDPGDDFAEGELRKCGERRVLARMGLSGDVATSTESCWPRAVPLAADCRDTGRRPAERGGSLYDLQAVSNHYGSTGGGHYTAYARNDRGWYKFDDSHTAPAEQKAVVTPAAYVLIYVKRGAAAGSPELEL